MHVIEDKVPKIIFISTRNTKILEPFTLKNSTRKKNSSFKTTTYICRSVAVFQCNTLTKAIQVSQLNTKENPFIGKTKIKKYQKVLMDLSAQIN